MRDFDDAIDRLIAGLEKKRVMSSKEREIVAYHESGHAIVATLLPGLDPVHKISIVQRGFGALGYTMQLPLEDRYLMQRDDLGRQLAVLLGGRAAEEIALGEISTGAQNDLQRATDIARAMVTEWGMSDALGAVNLAGERRGRFIDPGVPAQRGPYSEETARQIDYEVRRIVQGAHDEARRLLDGASRAARAGHAPAARTRGDGRRRAAGADGRGAGRRRRARRAQRQPGTAGAEPAPSLGRRRVARGRRRRSRFGRRRSRCGCGCRRRTACASIPRTGTARTAASAACTRCRSSR